MEVPNRIKGESERDIVKEVQRFPEAILKGDDSLPPPTFPALAHQSDQGCLLGHSEGTFQRESIGSFSLY